MARRFKPIIGIDEVSSADFAERTRFPLIRHRFMWMRNYIAKNMKIVFACNRLVCIQLYSYGWLMSCKQKHDGLLPQREGAVEIDGPELKTVKVVVVRGYTSRSLVLLTYDWPDEEAFPNFCGFVIERTPPFANSKLRRTKRTGEAHAATLGTPIRKSYWWDASISRMKHGVSLRYRVIPVIGPKGNVHRLERNAGQLEVLVP